MCGRTMGDDAVTTGATTPPRPTIGGRRRQGPAPPARGHLRPARSGAIYGQQGLEDVAWWWIAATDPALDDQAAVAEDGLTADLVALACVVVRSVTPDATYHALLTYLRVTSLRDLTTEAVALVPEEPAPFVHITLQDFTHHDVRAWIEETMNRRHPRIDAS
jgi:hypothetical protein